MDMIHVVLREGHVHGLYSCAVDAHLQAKPLGATVEQCHLNSEVLRLQPVPCEHQWQLEAQYGTKTERICSKCDMYQSDLLSPDCVLGSDGSGSGPCE